MIISLIAAMDQNKLIGSANELPWYLPADFKHFKEVTMGKPVVMGRKTFESIGKPLPGRKNIVISRSGFKAEGITVVDSIEKALHEADTSEEVMIIGGANIYSQLINVADRMYLTMVDTRCEGDAWFPDFDVNDWTEISRVRYAADSKNNYAFDILELERKAN